MIDPTASALQASIQHWRMPGMYARTHVAVACARGHEAADCLAQAQLSPAVLRPGFGHISYGESLALMAACIAIAGDDGMGIEVGERLPPTAIGNVGYAMLCSATLMDALALSERYWALLARTQRMRLVHEPAGCRMEIAFISARMPTIHNEAEMTLFGALRNLQVLLRGHALSGVEMWLDYPEPAHGDKYRARIPQVKFDMPVCALFVPARLLSLPIDMANPLARDFAIEQCQREEALLGLAEAGIVTRVHELLVPGAQGYPQIETVAAELCMSARTLRRRLGEEGLGFKMLLMRARKRDAIQLLDDYGLDIHAVALRLGYLDPSNFTRAFRQWTGMTPTDYRALRQQHGRAGLTP